MNGILTVRIPNDISCKDREMYTNRYISRLPQRKTQMNTKITSLEETVGIPHGKYVIVYEEPIKYNNTITQCIGIFDTLEEAMTIAEEIEDDYEDIPDYFVTYLHITNQFITHN